MVWGTSENADTVFLAFKVSWQQRLLISEQTQETHERDQRLSVSKPVNEGEGTSFDFDKNFFAYSMMEVYSMLQSPDGGVLFCLGYNIFAGCYP